MNKKLLFVPVLLGLLLAGCKGKGSSSSSEQPEPIEVSYRDALDAFVEAEQNTLDYRGDCTAHLTLRSQDKTSIDIKMTVDTRGGRAYCSNLTKENLQRFYIQKLDDDGEIKSRIIGDYQEVENDYTYTYAQDVSNSGAVRHFYEEVNDGYNPTELIAQLKPISGEYMPLLDVYAKSFLDVDEYSVTTTPSKVVLTGDVYTLETTVEIIVSPQVKLSLSTNATFGEFLNEVNYIFEVTMQNGSDAIEYSYTFEDAYDNEFYKSYEAPTSFDDEYGYGDDLVYIKYGDYVVWEAELTANGDYTPEDVLDDIYCPSGLIHMQGLFLDQELTQPFTGFEAFDADESVLYISVNVGYDTFTVAHYQAYYLPTDDIGGHSLTQEQIAIYETMFHKTKELNEFYAWMVIAQQYTTDVCSVVLSEWTNTNAPSIIDCKKNGEPCYGQSKGSTTGFDYYEITEKFQMPSTGTSSQSPLYGSYFALQNTADIFVIGVTNPREFYIYLDDIEIDLTEGHYEVKVSYSDVRKKATDSFSDLIHYYGAYNYEITTQGGQRMIHVERTDGYNFGTYSYLVIRPAV